MIGLNEQAPANTSVSAPPAENRAGAEAPPNGTGSTPHAEPTPAAPSADGPQAAASGSDRAEQLVDNLAHRVAYLAAAGTRKLVTFAARAREAMQDFWAEVQDFRRGRKS
jgi:hypothetical protein